METFVLAGPGLRLTFTLTDDNHLCLDDMRRDDGAPLLYADATAGTPGAGPVGNPLCLVILEGPHAGVSGMDRFRVLQISRDDRKMLVYLQHDTLPFFLGLEVEVEGHVATWRGQAVWNGNQPIDADVYYPLFSRVRFRDPMTDRALVSVIAGSEVMPLATAEFRRAYVGNLSSPAFLAEGGGRGLAFLDDNQADYAADPGACVRRMQVVGSTFPMPPLGWVEPYARHADPLAVGKDGPFLGLCHGRRFSGNPDPGAVPHDRTIGDEPLVQTIMAIGDAADLGPVRTYAYNGTWKQGADWLRGQLRHVPFRVPPAAWYRGTTFLAEDSGDAMAQKGQSFYDLPKILGHKETLGSNFFHFPGFHDGEVVGVGDTIINRGDYTFASQALGGFEAVRSGVDAVHRRGGRIIYYVEGLIMWKRARIGRSQGKKWALMKADGSYDEHYKGFWHMCPACAEWRHWLAETCAEILRSTGIDGFFIDSTCATHYHRCFNPAHGHPHPDVWTWGVRQLLREVREAVDRVNPEAVLIVEGTADLAREFADGLLSHGHLWSKWTLNEPFTRFLYPEMRAFESWGYAEWPGRSKSLEFMHIWNSVTGHRIYSHGSKGEEMAALSCRTRRYYDAFPEICDNPISVLDVAGTKSGMACLFDGQPRVLTVGNLSPEAGATALTLPVPAGVLFDRVDATRVPVVNGKATVSLGGWEFRAFEVRA